MKRISIFATALIAAGMALTGVLLHAAAPSAQPAAGAAAIAPADAQSMDRLNKSPRHGEFVQVPLPGSNPMKSWIVYPERPDKAPVVLVIMDIFGMSDWVRATTDQLAADGFIALAPDFVSGKGLNGGEVSPDAARGLVGALPRDEVMTKLNAAREYGLKLPAASGKTACIGFCWGGGMSFSYATVQPDLAAAVVCYGTPPADDQLAKIKAPIAGFYGGNDARITMTVAPTTEKMKTLNKVYEPHVYEGAGHGFVRQQTAGANAKAAQEAWPVIIKFLRDNTK